MFEKSLPEGPRQANLDYFFDRPENEAKRQEYIDRNLTPTTNLGMYFVVEPGEELSPGRPHPYDYTHQPFGPILQAFRGSYPELWERAKEVSTKNAEIFGQYAEAVFARDNKVVERMREEIREVSWAKAEVMDQVFRIIAPELEAAGIDPLEVCR